MKIDLPEGMYVDHIDLSDRSPLVGERMFAIGNPRGFDQTLSEGIISAWREGDGFLWIQHTAPISKGSSGGALIGADGLPLGIQSLTVPDAQNLNFGIPSSTRSPVGRFSSVEDR